MAQIEEQDLTSTFLSTPGATIVNRLVYQLSQVEGMRKLFGPYKTVNVTDRETDQQRWADYLRTDWSARQLPCINVYESGSEAQSSDEGYLTGTVSIRINWPANFRRSETARIPAVMKGVLQNFFSSDYVGDMLDEHYSIKRVAKVPGLNELGKTLTWSPNQEGIVASDLVPVTILDVSYRVDLRAWHRELERQGRTKGNPFVVSVETLLGLNGLIDGINNADPSQVDVSVGFTADVETP